MGKVRGRKYKRQHRRIEFVLNSEVERDVVIWDALERMARRGEASEFIKQTLYKVIVGDDPTQEPATRDDLDKIRDELIEELDRLRNQIANMRVVAGPSSLPEDDTDDEDERKRAARERLRKVSFKGLKK